jgi:hypothetical protein
MAAAKVAFTLDQAAVGELNAARRVSKPKSEVIRGLSPIATRTPTG